MRLSFFKNTFLLFILFTCFSCGSLKKKTPSIPKEDTTKVVKLKKNNEIKMGAEMPGKYLKFLESKKVGVVANQSSVIFENKEQRIKNKTKKNTHLVDALLSENITVSKVFAPEHGFRGKADAGETVIDGIDSQTGLPIISLYGNNKKPTPEQLAGIEVMVFDLQDVGARFYTYISTLHYVMEACAEAGIPIIIFDRPNPNGHYMDGPILEPEHKSFVGMHPIPVVHGMTMGEYAKMINGEGWLENKIKCDLRVIEMDNYNHQIQYSLPIKPSPNLPNGTAINLYPSLCFFEGTTLSEGRGTEMQFQIYGAPFLPNEKYPFTFTPKPNEGSKNPKFNGQLCYGEDLRDNEKLNKINLEWLIAAYNSTGKAKDFFTPFFTTLAGTKKLQQQIEAGLTAEEIRASWQEGLSGFREMREKYLIYE